MMRERTMNMRKMLSMAIAALALAAAGVSCGDDASAPMPGGVPGGDLLPPQADDHVSLLLKAVATDEDWEDPGYLRVVIVNTDLRVSDSTHTGQPWTVEADYRVSKSMVAGGHILNGSTDNLLKFPGIAADRWKRIYLLVDCEYMSLTTADGNAMQLTDEGAVEKLFGTPDGEGKLPIDYCTFRLGEKTEPGVPMTAMHEVPVPPSDSVHVPLDSGAPFIEKMVEVGPLYVARAANKVTFDFVNDTAHPYGSGGETMPPVDLAVTGWQITSTADVSYLFPRLGADWAAGLSVPDYYGEPHDDAHKSENYSGGAWMIWLAEEARKTHKTGDYDGFAAPDGKYEWMKAYALPEGATHAPLCCPEDWENSRTPVDSLATPVADNGYEATHSSSYEVSPDGVLTGVTGKSYYFAESKYDGATAASDGRTDAVEQSYTLSVRLRQTDSSGGGSTQYHTYSAPLPNCESLFRDTHLLVTVTFSRLITDSLRMEVDVVPYGAVELDPVFGLDVRH